MIEKFSWTYKVTRCMQMQQSVRMFINLIRQIGLYLYNVHLSCWTRQMDLLGSTYDIVIIFHRCVLEIWLILSNLSLKMCNGLLVLRNSFSINDRLRGAAAVDNLLGDTTSTGWHRLVLQASWIRKIRTLRCLFLDWHRRVGLLTKEWRKSANWTTHICFLLLLKSFLEMIL